MEPVTSFSFLLSCKVSQSALVLLGVHFHPLALHFLHLYLYVIFSLAFCPLTSSAVVIFKSVFQEQLLSSHTTLHTALLFTTPFSFPLCSTSGWLLVSMYSITIGSGLVCH